MRDLLEKITFAGQAVGQRPGDQVRGSEPMPRKGGGKKHPYAGRLVGGGAAESVEEDLEESLRRQFNEYGAQGSAIGNDSAVTNADRVMRSQEKVAGKQNTMAQLSGLSNELKVARAQLSQLNRSMPQGASPAEKAAALRDIQAQKIGIQSQIKGLSSQIADLRSQSF
jgi:predicted  nucleic acid-binding Zn-ribbon protein